MSNEELVDKLDGLKKDIYLSFCENCDKKYECGAVYFDHRCKEVVLNWLNMEVEE